MTALYWASLSVQFFNSFSSLHIHVSYLDKFCNILNLFKARSSTNKEIITHRPEIYSYSNLIISDALQTKAISDNILNFILWKSNWLVISSSANQKPGFWLKWWANQLFSLDHPETYVTNLNYTWKCLNVKTFCKTICSSILWEKKLNLDKIFCHRFISASCHSLCIV